MVNGVSPMVYIQMNSFFPIPVFPHSISVLLERFLRAISVFLFCPLLFFGGILYDLVNELKILHICNRQNDNTNDNHYHTIHM
jgi:hypothetical protein